MTSQYKKYYAKEDLIQCKICGDWLRNINGMHLKKHGLKGVKEYTLMFPNSQTYSIEVSKILAEKALRRFKDPNWKGKEKSNEGRLRGIESIKGNKQDEETIIRKRLYYKKAKEDGIVSDRNNRKFICKICGKEFIDNANSNLYCSKKCYGVDLGKRQRNSIKINCLICGKEFEKVPSDKDRKFCSNKCYGKYQRKRYTKQCLNCGKIFVTKLKKIKFCSKRCSAINMHRGFIKNREK